MKTELYFYDIYPKVLPGDRETTVHIRSLSPHTDFTAKRYIIRVFPMTFDVYSGSKPPVFETAVEPVDGVLTFSHAFPGEQEHSVRVYAESNPEKPVVKLSLYSLAPDLMERRPFMGDLHVHSCCSDGKEAPEFVAAIYREHGFDFMAVTDHLRRNPSLRAVEKFAPLDLDFRIYPGEEVHTPGNHVHFINFGGDYSVNDIARVLDDGDFNWDYPVREEWLAQVKAVEAALPRLPEGVDPFVHASSLVLLQKIREANGLSIFCHPHWVADVYNVTDAFTRFYLENGFADAFELIGGQTNFENMMQVAIYHDLIAKGCKIPAVSCSDSHGTVNSICFDQMKTLVFARENSRDALVSAVREGYCAALDDKGEQDVQMYAQYRLVSYGLFLYHNYFPLHDALCVEEGRLMRSYLAGDGDAQERLRALKGQTVRMMEKYFA